MQKKNIVPEKARASNHHGGVVWLTIEIVGASILCSNIKQLSLYIQ